jgi:YaiO family outer membrane protein
MLASLVLALMVGLPAEQPPAVHAFQEAERLARSGRTAEALTRFERVVWEHPGDVEARLWLARLLWRAGQRNAAEREFRRALALAPDHVDALTGLASLLATRGARDEASALLDRAEVLAPAGADVLAARAQQLRLRGRSSQAEEYYARARRLSPDDRDIGQALEQLRRQTRHRLETGFLMETATGTDTGARAADVTLDIRASDVLRFSTRVQAQSRFARGEARAGAGLEWRIQPGVTVRGAGLAGPGALILPRADVSGEVEHTRGRRDIAIGVRSIAFSTAHVWILAPGATFWFDDRTAVSLRYYGSRTVLDAGAAAVEHSGMVRVRRGLHPRVWLDGAYSRGLESFEQLSADRLGLFRADTISTGVLCHLPALQSIAANVDYQRRSDRRTIVRVTASIVHRF